jgi:hypothetical protein
VSTTAAVLILPLILFALVTLRKATAAPVPAVQAGFDADASDLMRMDSDKG